MVRGRGEREREQLVFFLMASGGWEEGRGSEGTKTIPLWGAEELEDGGPLKRVIDCPLRPCKTLPTHPFYPYSCHTPSTITTPLPSFPPGFLFITKLCAP